ncbi:MAG: J domain-containing protein [Chloroflexi bacterium]|nr:J domain-containing protein [Chloroflexota bacterium]
MDQNLTKARTNWQEQVEQLERQLGETRTLLIEAEAELAERLAKINAFEFDLRVRVGHLTIKLEKIEEEIKTYREKLRWMGDDWLDGESNEFDSWSMGERATASGEYRYRDARVSREPQQTLSKDETAVLKKLYRDLARRFHPDMAVDAADRDYRTQMMMAINAAYALFDLERLQELDAEPDPAQHGEFEQQDRQLVEALHRELIRLQRRLKEIQREFDRLDDHHSSKMMARKEKLEKNGRHYFDELTEQIQESIARLMVERDILKTQIENTETEADAFTGEDFAETVLDATEDRIFEENTSADFDPYIRKRSDRIYFEEDFDDDVDFE